MNPVLRVFHNAGDESANEDSAPAISSIIDSFEKEVSSKNIDPTVSMPNIVTIQVFKTLADAEAAADQLSKAFPDGSGIATTHMCPEEGEFSDWQGCMNDPRAQYREFQWP